MYKFIAILTFYKQFVVWSFIVNVIIALYTPYAIPALCIKLFLVIFSWYYFNETTNKRKLTIYKNLGISSFKLFSIIFIVDSIITLLLLKLYTEFL